LLVLGTASAVGDGVTNDALACGSAAAEVRYRKRCLTPRETLDPRYTTIREDSLVWFFKG